MLHLPVIEGTIRRRILLNYSVDPEAMGRLLPEPFKPRVHINNGIARSIAGVCLIQFDHLRPKGIPGMFGMSTENAACRFAVEWESEGSTCYGVYVPKRETSSMVTAFAGGKVFPGQFELASFDSFQEGNHYQVSVRKDGDEPHIFFDGDVVEEFPSNSIFESYDEAREFLLQAAVGYSPGSNPTGLDGIELRLIDVGMEPMTIRRASMKYLEDSEHFPPGSSKLDSAMIMRGLRHEWHPTAAPARDKLNVTLSS